MCKSINYMESVITFEYWPSWTCPLPPPICSHNHQMTKATLTVQMTSKMTVYQTLRPQTPSWIMVCIQVYYMSAQWCWLLFSCSLQTISSGPPRMPLTVNIQQCEPWDTLPFYTTGKGVHWDFLCACDYCVSLCQSVQPHHTGVLQSKAEQRSISVWEKLCFYLKKSAQYLLPWIFTSTQWHIVTRVWRVGLGWENELMGGGWMGGRKHKIIGTIFFWIWFFLSVVAAMKKIQIWRL